MLAHRMVLGPDLMTCPKYKRLIGGNCAVPEMKEVVLFEVQLKRAARLTSRKRIPRTSIQWTTTLMHSKIRFVMASMIIRDVWGVEAAPIAQSRIARQFRK